MEEAFERFLARAARVRPEGDVGARGGDRGRHAAGGLAVLAHPVWYRDPEASVERAARSGLDGVEVFHPDHDGREERFSRVAARLGLLVTAGSDFHHGDGEAGAPSGPVASGGGARERLASAAAARRAASGRAALDLSPR